MKQKCLGSSEVGHGCYSKYWLEPERCFLLCCHQHVAYAFSCCCTERNYLGGADGEEEGSERDSEKGEEQGII